MTQKRIANTDIKVILFGYNFWEKGISKKLVFTLKKAAWLLRVPPEAYGLLISGIYLKR